MLLAQRATALAGRVDLIYMASTSNIKPNPISLQRSWQHVPNGGTTGTHKGRHHSNEIYYTEKLMHNTIRFVSISHKQRQTIEAAKAICQVGDYSRRVSGKPLTRYPSDECSCWQPKCTAVCGIGTIAPYDRAT